MASEPELVRVRQQQAFETQRATVESKLQTGQPLDIYESIFLAKYYPDVSKQIARQPVAQEQPTAIGVSTEPTHIPTPLELRQRETKEFGQDIGNVKSLVGPGRYGTLTGWFLGRSEEAERFEGLMPFGPKTSKGLEATAGFVASGEGLVNPYTPFVLSPSFIIGYGAGVVTIGYGLGKVTKPLTEPFTDWLKGKGSAYLTRQYERAGTEGRLLDWKGPKERIVEIFTGGRANAVGPQVVDVPNAAAVTEGKATVTREFLDETMPSGYDQPWMKGKIVEGKYVGEGLAYDLGMPIESDPARLGFMKGYIDPATKTYVGAGLTYDLPKPKGDGPLSFFKGFEEFGQILSTTPKTPYSAPDTLLHHVLEGSELPPLRGLEAESGALSFGTTAKTALLDPELISPLENPVTRQIFSLPSGLPFLDVGGVERASFLPQAIGLAAVVGFGVASSQYGKAMMKTELPSRTLPKLESFPMSGLSLKPIVDLGSDVSLSPILALETLPIQRTMQEPIAKTVQTPRTVQIASPSFVQLQTPIFDREMPYMPKIEFFTSKRKGKGAWAKRYMWEFPVKGPKEMWKAI